MSSPQFTLYSHAQGPNGWKVAFVLQGLGLTYETKFLDFQKGEQKGAEFVKLNPNGRIPAIVDHKNNDFTLWESNAIMIYLLDTYDTEHKLSPKTAEEKAVFNQWMFFQASGQGPYFGQAAHFKMFAPEKIPYGVKRYQDEVKRVATVLESVLSKQSYLVGGRLTAADLAFVPWNAFGVFMLMPEGTDAAKEFPHLVKWHTQLTELPYVKEVLAEKAKVTAH